MIEALYYLVIGFGFGFAAAVWWENRHSRFQRKNEGET